VNIIYALVHIMLVKSWIAHDTLSTLSNSSNCGRDVAVRAE
jgi:hypothetical protein